MGTEQSNSTSGPTAFEWHRFRHVVPSSAAYTCSLPRCSTDATGLQLPSAWMMSVPASQSKTAELARTTPDMALPLLYVPGKYKYHAFWDYTLHHITATVWQGSVYVFVIKYWQTRHTSHSISHLIFYRELILKCARCSLLKNSHSKWSVL